MIRTARILVFGLIAILAWTPPQVVSQQGNQGLSAKVEKIFVERCFECHAGENAESGFRLDGSRETVLGGGDSELVSIVPGDTDKGSLLKWITAKEESERMPPDGEPLSPEQIDVIRDWIKEGARLDSAFAKPKLRLWSFQPIAGEFSLGKVDGKGVNRVDTFVANRLAEKGLRFNPREKRRTLIRRLYLVGLGIPPSPDDVSDFESDNAPDAYERLVERVLSSPAYGERWAQHWLDIIRFGETHGFETNRERPNAWPFRDYVIDSFNADKPYDQFVREQIAGDQLDAPVATGFIVAGPHDIVKSPDIKLTLMQRQDELADIVNVAGTSFLGLTVGCARCHDHKFDPISQKDFYSIQSVFAGVQHSDRTLPNHPDADRRVNELKQRIAKLERLLEPFVLPANAARIAIDDSEEIKGKDKTGIRYLVEPKGKGKNPAGDKRGFRDYEGSSKYSPNLSGGSYTWWENVPGRFVASYHPGQEGKYRIWLSWGSGFMTHSKDAQYVLDLDGDPNTEDDQKVLSTVNQVNLNDLQPWQFDKPFWSGFKMVGMYSLGDNSCVLLRGGKTGSVVTADVLWFEPVRSPIEADRSLPFPFSRPKLNARHNVELLNPVKAKFLRFTIEQSSQSQPCIDELEVFANGKNVALASSGTKASSNGDFVHPLHKLEHINDGEFGNSKSWIAKEPKGWVQLEFPDVVTINRVEWARDREGKFSDRVPIRYRIEVAINPSEWREIASSKDRHPFHLDQRKFPKYDFAGFAENRVDQGIKWYDELMRNNRLLRSIAKPMVVYAGTFAKPEKTHRLYRGDPFQKREQVEPNTIAALGDLELAFEEAEPKRRLEFANWLTRPDNPLVARVAVNRLWQHTFGQGIVATPNDFGNSGNPPTHPELLDWLARELIQSGWSLKHVHRQLFLSHAFRQSSQSHQTGMLKDASCELLWRFPPRRLEAEAIRDSILVVADSIDRKIGGPGFSGFEVAMENVRHFFPKKEFGPSDWRRMVYMTKVRQEKDSIFGAFDCPDASQVISRRSRSITPLQSLNLLNSTFVLQQAKILANRIERESTKTATSPVVLVYRKLFSREPDQDEILDANEFIKAFGLQAFCRAMLNANEFIFIQ